MRVIVAGGRNNFLTYENKLLLKSLVENETLTELVCGMASGIDLDAFHLLEEDVLYKKFPADWENLSVKPCLIKTDKYGKKYNALAGSNRNRSMAEYAEGVVLFEGGNGTCNMYQLSLEYDLKIIYNELEKE